MRYYISLAAASKSPTGEGNARHHADRRGADRPGERADSEVAAGEHPELALAFVKANFEALAAKRGPTFRAFFMSSLMTTFADRAHAEELANFAPVHETAGGRIGPRAPRKRLSKRRTSARDNSGCRRWVKQHAASS